MTPDAGREGMRGDGWRERERRAQRRAQRRAEERAQQRRQERSRTAAAEPVQRTAATSAEPTRAEPTRAEPTRAVTTSAAVGTAPTGTLDPEPGPEAGSTGEDWEGAKRSTGFKVGDLTPFLLVRAAHPRQALLTAVGMAAAGAATGRPGRELLLILVTVLVGQVVLGWFNDLVDRGSDARHQRTGKPLADGRLEPGTVWFCLALAVFLVVPLAIANGLYAGSAYLGSLALGLLGQWLWLRRGLLSWLPWAAAYALYPAFLSYGGWGGQEKGAPPELVVTGLAALLGIGVHLLTALWGLVPDNADGWSYLPLRLGLKLGASRLLWLAGTYTVLVLVGLAFAGAHVGLSQEPL
jgi:4-hydroxybenzoate polyprenyltransferase